MKKLFQPFIWSFYNVIIPILTFAFLMIDRAILVPFVMYSAYSVTELKSKPDRFLMFSIIRVMIAVIVFSIILTIKLIF